MTGSLQTKNGIYYAVINLTGEEGQRKQRWVNTKIPVNGNNIRKAKKALSETLKKYESLNTDTENDCLFIEYIKDWLETASMRIDEVTYSGYRSYIDSHIIPYFKPKKLMVSEVTPKVLQSYCNAKFKNGRLDGKGGLSPRSIQLHFAGKF